MPRSHCRVLFEDVLRVQRSRMNRFYGLQPDWDEDGMLAINAETLGHFKGAASLQVWNQFPAFYCANAQMVSVLVWQ